MSNVCATCRGAVEQISLPTMTFASCTVCGAITDQVMVSSAAEVVTPTYA